MCREGGGRAQTDGPSTNLAVSYLLTKEMSGAERNSGCIMRSQDVHFPGRAGLAEAAGVSVDVTRRPSCLEIPVNICSS